MKIARKHITTNMIIGTFVVLAILVLAHVIIDDWQNPQTVEQILQETRVEQEFVKSCEMLEEDDILISEGGRVFYVYGNWPGAVGTKSLSMSPSAETNSYEQFYQIYGSCRVVEAGSSEWVQIMRETF